MSNLSKVIILKISGTLILWCIPLILFPSRLLDAIEFPEQESYMFIRMLGWAYLSLCVGYAFALKASLKGERLMASIWVGVVSNGGAFLYLLYYGITGSWTDWGYFVKVVAWISVLATAFITIGLYLYGVKSE